MPLWGTLGKMAWITMAVKAGGVVYVTGEWDTQNCPKVITFKRKLIVR